MTRSAVLVAVLCACGNGRSQGTQSGSGSGSAAGAGSATPPIGAPKFCGGDDRTGVPLATSTFISELHPGEARDELESMNQLCGDTWCEGSFDWFFYDLRSNARGSEITMRTYATLAAPPGASASVIVVAGSRYTGRVLHEAILDECTSPCGGGTEAPTYAPSCLALDLRCELSTPWNRGSMQEDFIACGIALESAIRRTYPEFPPKDAIR